MALFKGKRSEVPSDAIILSKQEAITHQLKLLTTWKDRSDTFAFRNGGAFLASFSAFAGIYVNNHYRRKFKLGRYGHLSSFFPSAIIPSALSFLLHTQFVTTEITLPSVCATCMEIRASALQSMAGCVLPTILAPLAAIPLAIQYCTYDVPYITKEPVKVLRLVQQHTKPIANVLMGIFLAQALLGSIVTYFEAKSVHRVYGKLAELERKLQSEEQEFK